MMTKFSYLLRNSQYDLDRINDSINDNYALIKEYKNDKIVVSTADRGTNQVSSTVTDYYNELIKNQAGFYSDKAELSEIASGGIAASPISQILVELVKMANLVITIAKAAACGTRLRITPRPSPSCVGLPRLSTSPLSASGGSLRPSCSRTPLPT